MKANLRAIIQSFVLPTQKLKKTAEEVEAQYKSRCCYFYGNLLSHLELRFPRQPLPHSIISILDRVPGQIETLTDLLLEDFKSFGTCQELGAESAKFIHNELETTWGSSHLAVLDEQEAQKWLLGVGAFVYSTLHPSLGYTLYLCLFPSMS